MRFVEQLPIPAIALAIVLGVGTIHPAPAQTFTKLAYTSSIDVVADSPSGVVRDAGQ